MGMDDHWAYFGDGNAARIVECKDIINNKTGVQKVKFIFIPSEKIENQYDIKVEQDPSTKMIIREYKKTNVIFLERGVGRTRCWVTLDFNGGPTVASRREQIFTDVINDNDRLLRSAEASKNRLQQELDTERLQKTESLKIQANMIKQVASARGRYDEEVNDGERE